MSAMRNGFVIGLMLASLNTYASDGYKCHVKTSSDLKENGQLTSAESQGEFVVDRTTGRMMGDVINSYGQSQVVDPGSSEQAFKAITMSTPNNRVAYLYVEEFSESTEKPFMFVFHTNVKTGTCVNY